MLDFVQFSTLMDVEAWENNPCLDVFVSANKSTGELSGTEWAQTKGGLFKFKKTTTQNKVGYGSLHKYYHGGINYNRFSIPEIRKAIDKLENLGVNPMVTNLQTLEVEFNLYLDIDPQRIQNAVMCSGSRVFKYINRQDERNGIEARGDKYTIKLYDKGRTEKRTENILRVGVRMQGYHAKRLGAETLADLKRSDVLVRLTAFVWSKLSGVVYVDVKADTSHLKESDKLKYERFTFRDYWRNKNAEQRKTAKQSLRKLSAKMRTVDYRQILLDALMFEIVHLFEKENENLTPIFRPLEIKLPIDETEKRPPFSDFSSCRKSGTLVSDISTFKNESTERKKTPSNCQFCNGDLSAKKKGAKYCCDRCRMRYNNAERKQKREKERARDFEILELLGNGSCKCVRVHFENGETKRVFSIKRFLKWEASTIEQIQGLSFSGLGKVGKLGSEQSQRMIFDIVRLSGWGNVVLFSWEQLANRRLISLSADFRALATDSIRKQREQSKEMSITTMWRTLVFPKYGISKRTCYKYLRKKKVR